MRAPAFRPFQRHGMRAACAGRVRGMLLAWLAAVLMLATAVPAAGAQEPQPGDITARDEGYRDFVVQGVAPNFTLFLSGPGLAEVAPEGSFFHVEFAHSQVLERTSTVRIDFNGVPMTSVFLTDETATGGDLDFAIPGDSVNPNINSVKFQFFMRISDNVCRDWSNPALSATVFDSSFVHYELTGRQLEAPAPAPSPRTPAPAPAPVIPRQLETYPTPLLDLRKPTPDPITIVIPDDPTSEDLSAAVSISAELGRLGSGRPIPLADMVLASAVTAETRDTTNMILIGTPAANPEIPRLGTQIPVPFDGTQFFDADNEPLDPDTAVVAFVESPVNPERTVLLVSGGSQRAIRRGGLALSNDGVVATLSGAFAMVSEDLAAGPDVERPTVTRLTRTLADLGAGPISVSGAGRRTGRVTFLAPPPGPDNELTLELTHSPLLSGLSALDLIVNGVLVSAVQLDDAGAGDAAAHVRVPAAALQPGFNVLEFRFQLIVDENLNCGELTQPGAWATVLPSSVLDLDVGRPVAPSFESLPHPFLTPDGFRDATIVAGINDNLSGLAQLALELGRVSPSEDNWVPVVRPESVDDALHAASNLILYGTFGSNSAFDRVAEVMPLRFDPDVGLILQGRAGELLGARGASELAVVQIADSPVNPARRVLMLAATSPELLIAGAEAIGGLNLTGNLATITADGTVSTLSVAVPRPAADTAERLLAFGLTLPVIVTVLAALGLAALIAAIGYQSFRGRSRGTR